MSSATPASNLRALLKRTQMLVAPGAYDAVGARQIEQAGFDAVYMTGGGTSMAHGFPDFGLLDQGEMAANALRMTRSISVPLIADADTGYGNELNVARTVREYEMRGVAGLHIEDQVSPKRCGHLEGKEVISLSDFVSKIRAAVQARRNPDTLIIARTDARAVLGLDEAIVRANEALAAGADMAFVEAMQSLEEVAAVPKRVLGPCLLNLVPGGMTPLDDVREAEAMGYRLTILPGLLMIPAIDAGDAALHTLRETGRVATSRSSIGEIFRRFGAREWDELRQHVDKSLATTSGQGTK